MAGLHKKPSMLGSLLERTLDEVEVGVWEWTSGSHEVRWTTGLEAIFGFAPGTFPGTAEAFLEHVHPEDRDAWQRDVERCMAGEGDHNLVFRVRSADGAVRWVHAVGSVEFDSDHRLLRMMGTAIDVTDAQSSADMLAQFFDQAMNLHFVADFSGVIRHVNRGCEPILGYRPDDLVQNNILDFVHPDDVERTRTEIGRLSKGSRIEYVENRYICRDGSERVLAWSATASADSRLFFAVASDITERLRTQEQLEKTVEQLRLAVDTAKLGIWHANIGSGRQEWNDQQLEIYGIRREDFDYSADAWRPRVLPEYLAEIDKWSAEIIHRGSVHDVEFQIRRTDGDIRHIRASGVAIRGDDGDVTDIVGINYDITSLKRSEERLRFLAHHDDLTELPNRILFLERLEQRILQAKRIHADFAVLFVDVDLFKSVNDRLGHAAGDTLLKEVARRLVAAVRADDTVARISGDEFVLLLGLASDLDHLSRVIGKLIDAFSAPFVIGRSEVLITVSLGVAVYPQDGSRADELVANADAAMYRAKQDGRNGYQFYSEEMTHSAMERMFIEQALKQALSREQFHLEYQPKVDLATQRSAGLEALIRWRHPDEGNIEPKRFIPVAEHSGMIREIGEWVLNAACQQASQWLKDGVEFGHVAVNVATRQVLDRSFIATIKAALASSELPPAYLQLELTEQTMMQNAAKKTTLIDELRELEIKIAVDDFGTGYSSLSYLKSLPVDILKIDRSFIEDIPEHPDDMAITSAVIAMAGQLGLGTVAEGVESDAQAEFLRSRGCHLAQGSLFSAPLPPAEIPAVLRMLNAGQ
ncbi:MAG: EAL domain-containing protein [Pseudomonadota bacterium]